MSKRSILVLVASLALVLGATSAFADNSLAVTNAAAIVGNFGLEVITDGSSNSAFVQDVTPDSETVYRAGFRMNPNGIAMDEGSLHAIMMGRMQGGQGNIIRLYIRRQGGTYKLRCRWKKDGGGTGFCGQFTFAPNNTRITVEWVQSDGSDNGRVRLTKGTSVEADRMGLANGTFDIDTVRLGMPQGTNNPTTNGTYYVDEFESFRTLAP